MRYEERDELMMDINGWSYWIENTEKIKSELISDKANIKGLNKRERLEYADLENQHNEQKSNRVIKNKIPRKTWFSKKCFKYNRENILSHN